jgi:dienelactone hydrolase
LLDEQVDDVAAAVSYVRGLPDVDPTRVALVGCSFGGIETLLAASRDLHLSGAIDFAGGAAVWAKNGALRADEASGARRDGAGVLHPGRDDFDTTPSRILSEEMRAWGVPCESTFFRPTARHVWTVTPSATAARTLRGVPRSSSF